MAFPSSHNISSHGYTTNGHSSGRPNAAFEVQVPLQPVSTLQQKQQNLAAYQAQSERGIDGCYPQYRQTGQHLPPHKQPAQLPATATSTAAATSSADVVGAGLPVDYKLLLLSLAEEYFAAAHGRGSMVGLATRAWEVEQYHGLIAFGLGCLETVLKRWRLPPRMEARILLRYACVLHEETENDLEAETTLSKGVTLCERNRLIDLKYSMQHLLARVMFKTNPKASLKYLEGILVDVEALQQNAWIYTFRLLHVSLSLEFSSFHERHTALQSLRCISIKARDLGDAAMFGTSSILEAVIQLQSSTPESIEQAQRALAAAQSIQLNDVTERLPQLKALSLFLDLSCSLQESNTTQAAIKSQTMRAVMDQIFIDSHWKRDGSFSVPMNVAASSSAFNGGYDKSPEEGDDGKPSISFAWLPARDIYALAYFLCGVTTRPKNAFDHRKAEEYFREGIRQVGYNLENHDQGPQSVSSAAVRLRWRRELQCYMRLHLAFTLCARTDWVSATALLEDLNSTINRLRPRAPEPLTSLVLYLNGTICQGTGNVTAALSIYQQPSFALRWQGSSAVQHVREIAILAALNTILILREPLQPKYPHLETILASIEPYCLHHPNKNIVSAYQLVRATALRNCPIIKTKEYLQLALAHAKSVANHQLQCIGLNFMSWKFFRGVVGEQAEKSAQTASTLAKREQNSLWTSVAEGLLANTFEVQGKFKEAEATRQRALMIAQTLPPAIQRRQEDGLEPCT